MKWLALAVAAIVAGMVYLHWKNGRISVTPVSDSDAITPDTSDPITSLYLSGNAYWIPDSPMSIVPQSDSGYASGPAGGGDSGTFPYDIVTTFH